MSDTVQKTITAQQIIGKIIKALDIYGVPYNIIEATKTLKDYGMDYIDVIPLIQHLDTVFDLIPGKIADYVDNNRQISFNKNIFPSGFYDNYNDLSVLDLVCIVCKVKGIDAPRKALTDLLNKTLITLHKGTQSDLAISAFTKEK